MRIWSLHPEYLDAKGLVALWRETLLAKHVLQGKTKGYKFHPQLERFKNLKKPVNAIDDYLSIVYLEALRRGYNFDEKKIDLNFKIIRIPVSKGQLEYETAHLLSKLKVRDKERYKALKDVKILKPHPLFTVVDGPVESWEKRG
jgi:hypothetical protein